MNKIFITGCAKSGTTLLLRLFNAFDNLKVYNYNELSLYSFINRCKDYNVAKRNYRSIFSNTLSQARIQKSIELITDNNITVINTIRDRKDIFSKHRPDLTEKRYEASIYQAKRFSQYIKKTIYYKELFTNPDDVQREVANLLDLKIKHLWSDYPSFYDDSVERRKKRLTQQDYKPYTLRKIGAPYK